tara:strand:+ start:646 stop:1320 length:675 start_codon:yes stop_codon:yes gene_type:complete
MKLLELFSGTHSVGKVACDLGYEVISLDINSYKGHPEPTHKQDILTFDYKQYPPNTFDVIWASPPCTYFSLLQYAWVGRQKGKKGNKYTYTKELFEADIQRALTWVKKTLEIIDYFKPKAWFMENPETGTLKKQDIVKDLPYITVDYCRYADWGYRKRTRIWTNVKYKGLLCLGQGKCPSMKAHRHIMSLGTHNKNQKSVGCGDDRTLKFRIPGKLIQELFLSI